MHTRTERRVPCWPIAACRLKMQTQPHSPADDQIWMLLMSTLYYYRQIYLSACNCLQLGCSTHY